MNYFIKRFFLVICKYVGIYALFKFLNRKKLLILTYHGAVSKYPSDTNHYEYRNCVAIDQFNDQINYLQSKYKSILPNHIINNDYFLRITPYSFLITFDDGFRNNFTLAFPLLKEKKISAIFFVTTGFMGKRDMLWTEKIIYLIMHTKKKSIFLEMFDHSNVPIANIKEKITACEKIRNYLKHAKKDDIIDVLEVLEEQIDDVRVIDFPNERYEYLKWEEIKEMRDSGMIIGSHTVNHMLLSCLNDEEVEYELIKSKEIIEKNTQSICSYFCYPNGALGNFSARDKAILKKIGYKCAFSQIIGFNDNKADLYELKRINVTDQMDLITFEAYICGFIPFVKRLFSK